MKLEGQFQAFDNVKHPLHDLRYFDSVDRLATRKGSRSTSASAPPARRQEERHAYVPPWWRGEDANAKIALNTMKTLPK